MNTLKSYICQDIQAAINGKANYLAALGLSTYTENLGGMCYGDLEHNLGANYLNFIEEYFPSPYKSLNSKLSSLGGLYKVVRCGLVHEYFMKCESVVTANKTLQCGIIYETTNNPPLEFNVIQYFIDFKEALDKYYNELIGTTNPMKRPILESNFDSAINKMPFRPFDPSTTATSRLEGASGKAI